MRFGGPAAALFLVMAALFGVLVAWTLGGPFGASCVSPVTMGIDFNRDNSNDSRLGGFVYAADKVAGQVE